MGRQPAHRRAGPVLQLVALGALGALGRLGVTGCGGPPAPTTSAAPAVLEPNAVVERVVDGDTIDVRVNSRIERVRLIGIDTPEIAHDAFDGRAARSAECFGDDAHRYVESLLPAGTAVRLERDVVPRDDYGRLLAYVYRARDGIHVNVELMRHGYAEPLTIAPNDTFERRFVEAAREARTVRAGLWSACR